MEVRERVRAPLSRAQVLAGALRYVDEHGLDALSMHKLGATLGVRAMSLYKHVASKDDLLDGIVEALWTEIPVEPAAGSDGTDWREGIRRLAAALRQLVHRHPHAASLLNSRRKIQEHPLRICHELLRVMRHAGVPDRCSVPLLRIVFTYSIGYALAELSFPQPEPDPDADDDTGEIAADDVARIRRISALLSADAPDDLIRTALLVCGGCDMNAHFDIGLNLMIHGLDAHLDTQKTAPAE